MSSPDTSGYLKQWAEMRYIMERANAWNKYDSKKKAEVFDFAEQYRPVSYTHLTLPTT